MGKQFLIWFAAALVGGLLLVTIGSYLRGSPPAGLTRAMLGSSSPLTSEAGQAALRASAPAAPPGVIVLKRGDPVPASLSLPGLDGKPHALATYRGRRVLLNFWATWCHPCRAEMPMLARWQRQHPDQVQVIGIAMDEPASVRAYLRQTPVNYPIMLGLDVEPDLTTRFDDTRGALPYSVLIDPDGRIQATHLGKLDPALLARWLQPVSSVRHTAPRHAPPAAEPQTNDRR
ncbi:MAG TPA: TlpA disulfide reductase family protein [Rhodanobacteraceae bacterium]